MKLEVHLPCTLLQPFIRSYRFVHCEEDRINRLIPTTSLTLAFKLQGTLTYVQDTEMTMLPSVTFSGLRKTVRLINYAPGTTALIVQFKELAASAFFRDPLHVLFEQSVAPDPFFRPQELALLEEQLADASENVAKIHLVEQFLITKLLPYRADRQVTAAVRKIHQANGQLSMRNLAADLCLSQDAFEKRFRKRTGATPKQFASIIKMKSIIAQHSSGKPLITLALENGYFDQAHFNKDFKQFTGQAPTQFFSMPPLW